MTVCDSCGAWFVWPPRTPETQLAHYRENVDGMPATLREWRTDTSQSAWYDVLAKRMARRASGDVRRIVDVGAGALELTASLARRFANARVEAWDLFAGGIPQDLASNVSARRIDLNELPPMTESFDVVACVAVIEHVIDPLALLRFLRSITAPRGFAYVVGPEVTAVAHHIMRASWPYYCPDEHVTLPSFESIRKAVALAGGGRFALRRTSVYYSLKYLLRFLRVPIPLPAAADLLLPVPAGAFELTWYNDASEMIGVAPR